MVNTKEAETVRLIFRLYIVLRSVRKVRDALDCRSIVSKRRVSNAGVRSGGVRFGRGALYQMLANPIYVGEIRHKRVSHPGQHEPIIEIAVAASPGDAQAKSCSPGQRHEQENAQSPRGQAVR